MFTVDCVWLTELIQLNSLSKYCPLLLVRPLLVRPLLVRPLLVSQLFVWSVGRSVCWSVCQSVGWSVFL